MWQRWNGTSKKFEKSTDNGATWSDLGLDAAIITQGTLADARLSSNIPLKNAANTFTNATGQTIAGVARNNVAGGGALILSDTAKVAFRQDTSNGFALDLFNGATWTEFLNIGSSGLALHRNNSRASGASVNALTLADTVTGVQTADFGCRIIWNSNNGSTVAGIAFEVGGTGTNNESQIAFMTQDSAGALTRQMTLGSKGHLLFEGPHINIGVHTYPGRSVTNPIYALNLFNGTAPAGTLANGVTLYSSAGELRVMDSAGNSTLLSPHNDEGEWVYDSTSPITGKHLHVAMERLAKFIDSHFGTSFVTENAIP